MQLDFSGRIGDANVDKVMADLRDQTKNMLILDEKEVHSTKIPSRCF